MAIVLVIPDQARWVLGPELFVLGTLIAIAMVLVGRGTAGEATDDAARLAQVLDRTSPNALMPVLIALAGVSVIARVGGGLYWLVPAVVLALVAGVANTWLFLIRLST